jgi:hypothetical protein
MELISIKKYAQLKKLTIYAVVKKTKDGSLKTEKKEGEIFIYFDENEMQENTPTCKPEEKVGDFEKAYFKLKLKYEQLEIKYKNLLTRTAPR